MMLLWGVAGDLCRLRNSLQPPGMDDGFGFGVDQEELGSSSSTATTVPPSAEMAIPASARGF